MAEDTNFIRQKKAFFKKYEPFSSLSGSLLQKIVSHLQVQHHEVGQTICKKGHRGNCLFIIHTGVVVETFEDSNGAETTVAMLREGDCFGTVSLLTDEPYLTTIKVTEDVELYVFHKNDIQGLIQANPVLNSSLNRVISKRIQTYFDFFARDKVKMAERLENKIAKERKLDVINKVTRLFHSEEEIGRILPLVVKEVNNEMNADACSIFLVDPISGDLALEASVGFDYKITRNIRMRLDKGEGITGWVVKNGKPVALEDVHVDPRVKFITEIHEERLTSLLSVPLGDKKNIIGAINIQTVDKRKYTYDDVRGLSIMANHISLAISRSRLEKRMRIVEGVSDRREAVSSGFVGKGRYVDKINSFVDSVAATDASVMISGEDGTGTIPMSRAIHHKSKRSRGPFVKVDCVDICSDSCGEELFGYEKSPYIISCDDAMGKDVQDSGASPAKEIDREDMSAHPGYIELADSGTIFLNHVDRLNQMNQIKLLNYLQEGKFKRVNGNVTIFSNARIIATVSGDMATSLEKGSLDRNLYSILVKNSYHLEALRNQKRSIPMLTKHFIQKISRELHKDIETISDDAMGRLMSYDWPGNVRELENVLRRAVILAEGNSIMPDQIFFGIAGEGKKWSFNVLSINALKGFLKSRYYPQGIQILSFIVLVMVLCMLFVGHKDGLLNFASVFLWSTGLFGMYLITLISGRSLCGICPFAAAGDWTQRLKCLSFQIPRVFVVYGRYITIGMILLIFWLEGLTIMPRSSILTASLLVFILTGAVVSGFVYEKRVWCRYVCPLGGLLGTYTLSSFTSLKANRSVCLNQCETHDCYLGTRSIKGCPMFLRPYGLESSRDCVLCMNCYRDCGHGSIKLNLQAPGSDIAELTNRSIADSFLSLSLLGILLVEYRSLLSIDSEWFKLLHSISGINQSVLYTLLFIFVSIMPFVSIGFLDYVFNGFSLVKTKERIADFGYSAIPLALMGHLAFYWDKLKASFRMLLELSNIDKSGGKGNDILISGKEWDISSLELLFVVAGFIGSVYVFNLISKKTRHSLSRSTIAGYITVFAVFAVIYLCIL